MKVDFFRLNFCLIILISFLLFSKVFGQEANPCPLKEKGDANCDNNVNKYDFLIWKCEFLGNGTCSNPVSHKTADFNDDDRVDLIDFEILRTNFAFSLPPTPRESLTLTPTSTRIPTPTTTINECQWCGSNCIYVNPYLHLSCPYVEPPPGKLCVYDKKQNRCIQQDSAQYE